MREAYCISPYGDEGQGVGFNTVQGVIYLIEDSEPDVDGDEYVHVYTENREFLENSMKWRFKDVSNI
jgi:hypothetical protein